MMERGLSGWPTRSACWRWSWRLLEEHGMTLPPEQRPLRGFARSGQVNWRRTALDDTRKARARREFWHRVRRWLTLGLWWK